MYEKEVKKPIAKGIDDLFYSSIFERSTYCRQLLKQLCMSDLEIRVEALHGAMKGWGCDEFTLTGLICTVPEHMFDNVNILFAKKYCKGGMFGYKSLTQWIDSDTSFSYGTAVIYQSLPKSA